MFDFLTETFRQNSIQFPYLILDGATGFKLLLIKREEWYLFVSFAR